MVNGVSRTLFPHWNCLENADVTPFPLLWFSPPSNKPISGSLTLYSNGSAASLGTSGSVSSCVGSAYSACCVSGKAKLCAPSRRRARCREWPASSQMNMPQEGGIWEFQDSRIFEKMEVPNHKKPMIQGFYFCQFIWPKIWYYRTSIFGSWNCQWSALDEEMGDQNRAGDFMIFIYSYVLTLGILRFCGVIPQVEMGMHRNSFNCQTWSDAPQPCIHLFELSDLSADQKKNWAWLKVTANKFWSVGYPISHVIKLIYVWSIW